MKNSSQDWLLAAGRILTLLGQGIMLIGGAAILFATGGVALFRESVIAELATEFPELDPAAFGISFFVLMAIAAAFVVIGFYFLNELRQIIDTVAEGDPFVPENGDRLTRMGWLAVGSQVLSIPAAAAGLAMAKMLDASEHESVTTDMGFDPTGLLLIVTLFILARVFKSGAAMREDLEGTV
ncbi:MAG: DUF2975 domain-containing protein [Erythrobacter sp.]